MADVTDTPNEPLRLAEHLSEMFGVEWDPNVMAYEEPHIFRSTPTAVGTMEVADAEC
jgi:hypothetical protein